jgi:hypothetical protein
MFRLSLFQRCLRQDCETEEDRRMSQQVSALESQNRNLTRLFRLNIARSKSELV